MSICEVIAAPWRVSSQPRSSVVFWRLLGKSGIRTLPTSISYGICAVFQRTTQFFSGRLELRDGGDDRTEDYNAGGLPPKPGEFSLHPQAKTGRTGEHGSQKRLQKKKEVRGSAEL